MARKLLLSILGLLLLLVLAGAAYNAFCVSQLQRRYPVPGKLVAVNGSMMHLYCTGSGSPTVVLESGLGGDWIYWQKVQPEAAKATRVCSYDRAGIGWSDPQPGPRDARNIAQQLHALLHQAGEAAPFVLVGGSAGGLYVRQFTALYPNEVAALVFADASLPEQIQALPGAGFSEATARKRHREARWEWLKEGSGWARLTGKCRGEVERGLEAYLPVASAEACRPELAVSWLGEWDEFWHSAEEAGQAECCGDRPVLIISQDPDRPKPGWTAQAIAANPIWNSLQEHLKGLSPHSRRIIARSAGHHVMIDRPDVIIRGIGGIVAQVRNGAPDPAEGTTIVE
jgi:pimeloyl-ACP methyl ester carboxylesterase